MATLCTNFIICRPWIVNPPPPKIDKCEFWSWYACTFKCQLWIFPKDLQFTCTLKWFSEKLDIHISWRLPNVFFNSMINLTGGWNSITITFMLTRQSMHILSQHAPQHPKKPTNSTKAPTPIVIYAAVSVTCPSDGVSSMILSIVTTSLSKCSQTPNPNTAAPATCKIKM